jgi:hypothetical protein
MQIKIHNVDLVPNTHLKTYSYVAKRPLKAEMLVLPHNAKAFADVVRLTAITWRLKLIQNVVSVA